MNGRKYTDEQYLSAEYFAGDEEHSNYQMRLVNTRKDHACSGFGLFVDIDHFIPANSRAILETAIHVDAGYVSCYLCLDCADSWLDQIL